MIFATILFFVFGAAIGSFLNVVILRLREGKSLGGRSSCPYCHHTLSVFDLVPILSYVFLGGSCRYCKHRISVQYPLVELLTATSFSLLFLTQVSQINAHFFYFNLLFLLFTLSVLIVISVYDIRWGIIPDRVIIPASIIALFKLLFVFVLSSLQAVKSDSLLTLSPIFSGPVFNLVLNLATAILIGLFFLAVILVTQGKGMGGGDLKLSIFIGLALGWPLGLVAVLLGFLTGALGSVMLILLGKKSFKQTVPFGPFLALGSLIAILYGNRILELYLKSMGLN